MRTDVPLSDCGLRLKASGFSSTMTNGAPSISISTTILCSPASLRATSIAPKATL